MTCNDNKIDDDFNKNGEFKTVDLYNYDNIDTVCRLIWTVYLVMLLPFLLVYCMVLLLLAQIIFQLAWCVVLWWFRLRSLVCYLYRVLKNYGCQMMSNHDNIDDKFNKNAEFKEDSYYDKYDTNDAAANNEYIISNDSNDRVVLFSHPEGNFDRHIE